MDDHLEIAFRPDPTSGSPPVGPVEAEDGLSPAAKAFASASLSKATRRAYGSQWRAFEAWCGAEGKKSLPASSNTVASYLAALAGRSKVSTVEQALAATSKAHDLAGFPVPRESREVRSVMQGIRRELGTAPRQKDAAAKDELLAMLEHLPPGLRGVRDRALLLVGWAGAFRRSEIVALDVADIVFTRDGLEITIRRSKTDPEGRGRKVGIPFGSTTDRCPVRSLASWLAQSGIDEGPLFRGMDGNERVRAGRSDGCMVTRVVKRAATAAGLDPSRFSGHSLRAGFVTAAARAGKSERSIQKQTGHRSIPVLRGYIRDADLFRGNAATGLL